MAEPRDYNEEMAEFKAMEDQIRDMDYYKAETEAARNGQEAAMAFAKDKEKEAAAHKVTAEFYIAKANDLERNLRITQITAGFVWLLVLSLIILLVIAR